MKLFNPKSAASERPLIRGWLEVFACGFLTICIFGSVVCLGLWLIGVGAAAIHFSALTAMFAVSMSAASHIILETATVFGVLLATLALVESARRKRQNIRIPGHHPIIGEFEQLPYFNTWHAKPMLPNGQTVTLDGPGSGPSEAQPRSGRSSLRGLTS